MRLLDIKEIERKLRRKLTSKERKAVYSGAHDELGLPKTKAEMRRIQGQQTRYSGTPKPVQGGAPGLGKRNSGNTRTMKHGSR